MKSFFLYFTGIIVFVFLNITTYSQNSQIVFQSDTGSTTSLWSVLAVPGAVPVELTPFINAQATQAGNNYGPVNVSHNGKWYTFQSERFDADCNGWHCLTLADSAFGNIHSVHDGNNSVIHNEGIAMASNNGHCIVYSSDAGPHTRDVFIIRKSSGIWSAPKILSSASAYAYNLNPRFSFDDSQVVFQGQNSSYTGESIMIVDTAGNNLIEKISRFDTVIGINGCSEVNAPSWAADGSLFFEGLWGGERVWHFPNGATAPLLPDPNDGNDNSPVGLPDGRLASLIMPNATHDLKVENADGTAKFFLTGSSTAFNHDVNDVGLGAGLATPFITAITEKTMLSDAFSLYPNPSEGLVSIHFDTVISPGTTLLLYSATGQLLRKIALKELTTTLNLPRAGVYTAVVCVPGKVPLTRKIVIITDR